MPMINAIPQDVGRLVAGLVQVEQENRVIARRSCCNGVLFQRVVVRNEKSGEYMIMCGLMALFSLLFHKAAERTPLFVSDLRSMLGKPDLSAETLKTILAGLETIAACGQRSLEVEMS